MATHTSYRNPRSVTVIGAGIVGLSCAWFLARAGVQVTVLERRAVAAGASAGNAGWISPGLATPLVSRESLQQGIRGLWDRRAPVVVPATDAVRSLDFLTAFARNARPARAAGATEALDLLNRACLDGFDALVAGGVDLRFGDTPILAVFPDRAAATAMHQGLIDRVAAGLVDLDDVDDSELRDLEPALTEEAGAGVRIRGQRWLDPLAATWALGDAVAELGGHIETGAEVDRLEPREGRVLVGAGGREWTSDATIVAAGVWTSHLRKRLGLRVPLRAGRGYSLRVRPREPIRHPVYLPSVRLACTPDGEDLRVTGIMELGVSGDATVDRRRLATIHRAARRFIALDEDGVREPWVGPRPLSADGLPLIGRSALPGVYVATGHGMFGLTQGAATGQLLAAYMLSGEEPPALAPLRPTRRPVRAAASPGS